MGKRNLANLALKDLAALVDHRRPRPRYTDPEEDAEALKVTRVSVGAESDDFAPLVARIAELRRSPRGRPPSWIRRLVHRSDRDIAAAVLYHLVRARLWIESHDDVDNQYLLTIGTDLGADLVGPDPPDSDESKRIGCALILIAEEVGIVTIPPAEGRGGCRVVFTDSTFQRLQKIINGASRHILRRIHTKPPTGVKTKLKPEMRLERPEAPLRVVEAADKIQGTAWRINRAVLNILDAPKERVTKQDLERKWTLVEARQLATAERFYFPVFTDFRGRINQRGGALTYTGGSDCARGLLEFADGEYVKVKKENGEYGDGFKWLTWHMAQMWGHKGLPLGDGTAWLSEGADRIERWQDTEHPPKHPVQFLAAALAVVDALKGLPVHLPVRVDASCSALQHLALLSADEELARLVNLWGNYDLTGRRDVPEEMDYDFYQRVADETKFTRAEVKSVIVPMLYGAGWTTTADGLAEQRKKPLSKRQEKDAEKIRGVANQLAPRAFGLLKWFEDIAQAHNGVEAMPIRWTAPSGFQVIQDYRVKDENPKRPDRQVTVSVNGRRRKLVKVFYTKSIDSGKQITSIAANIVHSLDAALLAEIVAGSSISTWGVIHDAFAVPANRVSELVDEDNPRAIQAMYEPDRLAEWIDAWRIDGVFIEQNEAELLRVIRAILGGEARRPLPAEMLGGLRALG